MLHVLTLQILLLKSQAVLKHDYYSFISHFFLKLMTISRMVLGKQVFSMVLRPSVYAQFVAGETEGEIAESMQKIASLGLRPMLAVPIEEDLGESTG